LFLKSQEFNYNLFNQEYNDIRISLTPRIENKPNQRKSTKTFESTRENIIRKTTIQRGSTLRKKEATDMTDLGDTDENQQEIKINTTEYNNNFIKKIDEKDHMIDKGMSKYAISSRGFQIVIKSLYTDFNR
jgi:hypothetical protein